MESIFFSLNPPFFVVQYVALLYLMPCVYLVLSFPLSVLLLKVFSIIALSPKLDCSDRVSPKIPACLDIINHHLFYACVNVYAQVDMRRLQISTALALLY